MDEGNFIPLFCDLFSGRENSPGRSERILLWASFYNLLCGVFLLLLCRDLHSGERYVCVRQCLVTDQWSIHLRQTNHLTCRFNIKFHKQVFVYGWFEDRGMDSIASFATGGHYHHAACWLVNSHITWPFCPPVSMVKDATESVYWANCTRVHFAPLSPCSEQGQGVQWTSLEGLAGSGATGTGGL